MLVVMEDWRVAVPEAQSGVNDTAGPTKYLQVLSRYPQSLLCAVYRIPCTMYRVPTGVIGYWSRSAFALPY